MSRAAVVRHGTAAAVVAGMLLGDAAAASAQIEAPTTWVGQVFGSQVNVDPRVSSQQLTLTLDLLAGRDHNRLPAEAVAPIDVLMTGQPSGDLSAGIATLRYYSGRFDRFFEAVGRGYGTRSTTGAGESFWGRGYVTGSTTIGDRGGLSGEMALSYQPSYLSNAFGPVAAEVDGGTVSAALPLHGITEQMWLDQSGVATAYRDWNARQRTSVSYRFNRREPQTGVALGSRAHAAVMHHSWGIRRRAALEFEYAFTRDEQDFVDLASQRLNKHAAELGVTVQRPLSATRRMEFSVGAGAVAGRTESVATGELFSMWSPTASASARLDLTRSWRMEIEARRDASLLQDLTPEPFAANAMSLKVAGNATPRTQIDLAGGYSYGASLRSGDGSYQGAVATAQIQFALARWCAVFSSYNYYRHQLDDVRSLQPGFPERYERHSVRAGLTFWMPLHGRF